jgi:DNA ligase (NAD+)
MRRLAAWGLPISPDLARFTEIAPLLDHYRAIERARADLPFDIDGVVYKVDRLDWQRRLARSPRHRAGRWRTSFRRSEPRRP